MGVDASGDQPATDLLGPFIDRTFRLVEMIGIIALLALALKNRPVLAGYATFGGELLAFIYWLEPTTNWLIERTYGLGAPRTRLLARISVLAVSGAATISTVPYVRLLTEALKKVL